MKRFIINYSGRSWEWKKAKLAVAKSFASALCVLFFWSSVLPTPETTAPPSGFLYRQGKTLMWNGQEYKFTGFNHYGFSGCEGVTYSDADIDAYFSSLQPYSITRTWAFEYWGFERLDAVIQSAEAHNQFVILTLADGRGHCNETDGRPGGDGSGKVAAWYEGGYRTKYIPWIQTVVARYKDSPAVGMWELINEPGTTGVSDQEMKAFFDEAAAAIKAIDPNHLVSSGAQAQYVSGTSDYAYVHSGPNIDVGTLHEYDYDYQGSNTIISPHLDPTLSAMNSINKPLVVGETGIKAANSNCRTSFATRSNAFRLKFDGYFEQGAAGVIIWNRSKRNLTSCVFEIGSSDPVIAMTRSYPYPGIGTPTPTPSPTPTSTPTPTPTPTPVPTPVNNHTVNGSFENGISPWILGVASPVTASLARDSGTKVDGNYSARVNVNRSSSNAWYVQFRQDNLSLFAGRTYTVTFWAKASRSRQIEYVLQKSASPYTLYSSRTVNLTTSWRQFTSNFAATNTDTVFFGFNLARTNGTVWIDKVSISSSASGAFSPYGSTRGFFVNPDSQSMQWVNSHPRRFPCRLDQK